jgi:hypothetical protein
MALEAKTMRLTMKERKVVTKATCEQYRKSSKKGKGLILSQFVQATGYSRCYARWLLRNHGRRVELKPGLFVQGDARPRSRPGRKKTYGAEVLDALKKVWEILDYISGKTLVSALPEVVPRLVALKELKIKKAIVHQLVSMSAATIDRLLKPERAKFTLKRRGCTKPGTLLKHQIPIRTFWDWDDAQPGFMEMDLVGHDGGVAQGDYCFTLDMTDVDSGWSEQAAVLNKAQTAVFEAIGDIRKRLPFAVLGLDSDNGSEFINNQLRRFCVQEQITFTRSRPNQKNDNCYVEQKNWSIVRRFAGYARYESLGACQTLNALYAVLRDYNNFFLPSQRLKEKIRDGAHVLRRYHPAKTPYRCLIDSPHLSQGVKKCLKNHYETLNPAALHRQILRLQKQLSALTLRVTRKVGAV